MRAVRTTYWAPESSETVQRRRGVLVATIEMPIGREDEKLNDETGGHFKEI